VDFLNEAIDKRIVLAQQQPKTKQRKPLPSSVNAAAAFVSTTSNTSMNKDDFAPFVSEPLTAKGTGKFARPGPVQNKGMGKGVSSAKGNQKSKGKGKSINIESDNWRLNSWRDSSWNNPSAQQHGTAKGGKSKQESVFHFGRKGKGKGGKTGNTSKGKSKGKTKGFSKGPQK